jgi:hypothetical protein
MQLRMIQLKKHYVNAFAYHYNISA